MYKFDMERVIFSSKSSEYTLYHNYFVIGINCYILAIQIGRGIHSIDLSLNGFVLTFLAFLLTIFLLFCSFRVQMGAPLHWLQEMGILGFGKSLELLIH